MKKKYLLLYSICLIGLFLFLRFYGIASSLFFQNDIGRDLLVLYDWKVNHQIPLLGPQNSALPFNQSAFYFYLLYPAFVLSNMSVFSSLYTNAIIYVLAFIFCLWTSKTQKLKIITLIIFALMTIHPQIILQNRYVWNPSFVPPFLFIALISLLQLIQKWSKFTLFMCLLGLTSALSFSYSVAPIFVAFLLVLIFKFKKHIWNILIFSTSLLTFINLPTIFFEFRHSFLLSKALLRNDFPPQQNLGLLEKLSDLANYSAYSTQNLIRSLILLIFLVSFAIWVRNVFNKKNFSLEQSDRNKTVFMLFIISFILTLISPFGIQSHYIFGILMLSFALIACLPLRLSLIFLSCLVILWLQPEIIKSIFKPAPRTVAQLDNCFSNICQKEKEPLFVTTQAGFHPYHVGPEFRYLMKKNGCNIQAIENNSNLASTMALVMDQSAYVHGQTSFYELSKFGLSSETKVYNCQGNINVHMLQKK